MHRLNQIILVHNSGFVVSPFRSVLFKFAIPTGIVLKSKEYIMGIGCFQVLIYFRIKTLEGLRK